MRLEKIAGGPVGASHAGQGDGIGIDGDESLEGVAAGVAPVREGQEVFEGNMDIGGLGGGLMIAVLGGDEVGAFVLVADGFEERDDIGGIGDDDMGVDIGIFEEAGEGPDDQVLDAGAGGRAGVEVQGTEGGLVACGQVFMEIAVDGEAGDVQAGGGEGFADPGEGVGGEGILAVGVK